MSSRTLILVYNAPDGIIAAVTDAVHKIVSPSTYPCSLCAITYGTVAMRRAWKRHLAMLPYPKRFYHREGFRRAHPGLDVALPVILLAGGDAAPRVLLDAATIDAQADVAGLIATLDAALATDRSQQR
jgi:S-formylglutathione hydrolase FrmB